MTIILTIIILTTSVFFVFFNPAKLSKTSKKIAPPRSSQRDLNSDKIEYRTTSVQATTQDLQLDQATLMPEQTKLLCDLRTIRSKIPLEGPVQIISHPLPPYDSSADRVAWVKSPECPSGRYSIIQFSPNRKILLEKDCRTASLTELASLSSMQGQINEKASKRGKLNLAISGPGLLFLECPSGELILSRDGDLKKDRSGNYKNKDGCIVLNNQGEPFHPGGDIGIDGCTADGECLSIIDHHSHDIEGLRYKSSNSFSIESIVTITSQINKTNGSRLIENALEELANENGPTSVSWEYEPKFDLDSLECPPSTIL